MQPEELRALRKGLGLRQEDLANEIGVSRKTVVEMESGKAPIERRTALAARQLYHEESRLFSGHVVKPMVSDIALENATILWDEEPQNGARIIVVDRGQDDRRFSSSYGACNIEWTETDDIGRLLRLLAKFVELTVREGIDPTEAHTALSVIPEYRRALDVSLFDYGVGYVDL